MGCTECPRKCNKERVEGNMSSYGYCQVSVLPKVARAALHFWEEPCISGEEGSGTVFFSGCNLWCVYCQNVEIAAGVRGKEISIKRLSEIFLELQEKGANNINLVTPDHYVPEIIEAVLSARKKGLTLPIVYNGSGYEKPEVIRRLKGIVDIFLTDFKGEFRDVAQLKEIIANYIYYYFSF